MATLAALEILFKFFWHFSTKWKYFLSSELAIYICVIWYKTEDLRNYILVKNIRLQFRIHSSMVTCKNLKKFIKHMFKDLGFCTKDAILTLIKAHLMFVRSVFWRVSKNSTMSLMSVLWYPRKRCCKLTPVLCMKLINSLKFICNRHQFLLSFTVYWRNFPL